MQTFFKDTLRDSTAHAQTRKAARRLARKAVKTRLDARELRAQRKVRDQVWARDNAVCRAYGVPVERVTEVPALFGHCAHVVAKSQGGPYTTDNLALLSAKAHERNHKRYDGIGLDMTGNADETLKFREFDLETGKTLREWESKS